MKESETTEKILKRERYKIKLPKSIHIYDELYLNNPSTKDLCVFLDNIPRNRIAELCFEVMESSWKTDWSSEPISMTNLITKICIAPDQEILDIFANNQHHPNLVKYQHELCCDTASFVIEIDNNYEKIGTGADGYYGIHIAYKYNRAHMIEFCVDMDMMSEKRFRNILSYLFDCKKIKEETTND